MDRIRKQVKRMKSMIGKFATGILCAAIAPLVFASPSTEDIVSNDLVSIGDTGPQDSLGFVVGQICPGGLALGVPGPGGIPTTSSGGVLLDRDLSARCNEVVAAAGTFASIRDSSDQSDARDGLQGFAPEEGAVVATSKVDAGSAQVDNISDRQASFRSPGGPSVTYKNNSGFNWSSGAAGDGSSPWGLFVNGLYVTSDRDSTSRESGFEADDFGVTGGIDYTFSDKLIFGVAFGYKNSDADIDANGGTLDTDSNSYSAYWSIYPDDRWYIDTMVGYTDSDHDQGRSINYSIASATTAGVTTVVNNTAVSDTESDEISVSVTAGHNFYSGNWTLSPYGRIDYADIGIDGFNEAMASAGAGSGLALQIDDQDF